MNLFKDADLVAKHRAMSRVLERRLWVRGMTLPPWLSEHAHVRGIGRFVDYTILRPDATGADVARLCDEAVAAEVVAVCVNGRWVRQCVERLQGTPVRVAAVVGFPLGAGTSAAKAAESAIAASEGAAELDMVIPIGAAKAGEWQAVVDDVAAVVAAAPRALVKVILETATAQRRGDRESLRRVAPGRSGIREDVHRFPPQRRRDGRGGRRHAEGGGPEVRREGLGWDPDGRRRGRNADRGRQPARRVEPRRLRRAARPDRPAARRGPRRAYTRLSDIVYLNGAFLPRERATVSVDDRGFLFGDGVYEVVRVVGGAYIDAGRHLARLRRSLAELRLPDPAAAGTDLLAIGAELLRRQGVGSDGEAVVYIQLTRGAAPRRHAFPAPGTPPTLFVSAWAFVPRREQMASGVAAITHADLRWQRCDIKSVNLLPNVLANQRATEEGAYEAILVRDGVVTEGTHSNVVAVLDGVLRTHPNGPAILAGVTREVVLELARDAGLIVREQAVTPAQLVRAEEVFFTGTTTDVMPVVSIDGRRVQGGILGPIARRLGERLTTRMEAGAEARSPG